MSLGDFFSDKPATSTQTSQSTTTANPWAPASGMLNRTIGDYSGLSTALTPEQVAAGSNLWTSAGSTPSFGGQGTAAVQSLFNNAGMIPGAYQAMQANLNPIASMSANPWSTPGFGDAMSTLMNNITNQVKGTYAASGRSPSGAGSFAGSLARGETQGMAPILQDQYNKNLSNIMSANQMLTNAGISSANAITSNATGALSAAGMLPSVAMAPAAAQYGVANALQSQPWANIDPELKASLALGGMGGTTTAQGTQTGTQTPAHNDFANVIGDIAGIAGAVGKFSDRRLKTDIKDVGRTHDNQKIYSYRFKGSNVPEIGLMADEVERHAPGAVDTDDSGYKRVRYDKATRKAAQMGMMRAY